MHPLATKGDAAALDLDTASEKRTQKPAKRRKEDLNPPHHDARIMLITYDQRRRQAVYNCYALPFTTPCPSHERRD